MLNLLKVKLCYCNIQLLLFFPDSEETEKGNLAGTKENVFGKCSDEFLIFLITHLLRQL